MDTPLSEIKSYIGQPASSLPTPSVILNRKVIEKNCKEVIENAKSKGLLFRPHVKTTKCTEVTRMMLGGFTKKAIASTLREIRGLMELVDSGDLEEILYGIPFHPTALPQLASYSQKARIVLMVDHTTHISQLETFSKAQPTTKPWPVFLKLDIGDHRAGVPLPSATSSTSPEKSRLKELITVIEASPAAELIGFYCHAGHSYSSVGEYEAAKVLEQEVVSLREAVALVPYSETHKDRELILSMGATPTAHVISTLQAESQLRGTVPARYELHGGNYPINDLQQLATALISEKDLALRAIASVCSVYPERNEALVNAGVLAVAREPGRFEGFGRVVGREEWFLRKLSQEHGVLATSGGGRAEEVFTMGEKVFLRTQHACITAAGHGWYFVVDGEEDVVRDVWFPWKGW